MNGHVTCGTRLRLSVLGLGPPLLLLIGGCKLLSAETLQEFMVDLARGALAAWLL